MCVIKTLESVRHRSELEDHVTHSSHFTDEKVEPTEVKGLVQSHSQHRIGSWLLFLLCPTPAWGSVSLAFLLSHVQPIIDKPDGHSLQSQTQLSF